MIKYAISKSNVVINLIGQNTETWNFGFNEVHVDFPRKLAEMCAASGHVERLIQASCFGADLDSPSNRLRTRAEGDAGVLEAFPDATIMRFGPLVGMEDRFFNDMANWRYSSGGVPVVDGGAARIQPTYVIDAAHAIYDSLHFADAKGATYDLGGPDILTYAQWGLLVCKEMQEEPKLMHIPSFTAYPMAAVRDYIARSLPVHMMTRDLIMTSANIAEADLDKVARKGRKTFADLQLEPASCLAGNAIDHVRHWRKGGYAPQPEMGPPQRSAAGSMVQAYMHFCNDSFRCCRRLARRTLSMPGHVACGAKTEMVGSIAYRTSLIAVQWIGGSHICVLG
eukprot:TRINITY_DN14429_c0_g1_i3.p1 TRINITY_DN14429_c0_g1~~TRINITY_DN14429_c0_g1_i3.p1  ORF type:complete len:354 (+),score=39.03 TRINITY_DN14429_c0_g1_i3:50-1063(+)